LFDLSGEIQYQAIQDVFPEKVVGKGFDIIATNPPYKNLKAEKRQYDSLELYEKDKNRYNEVASIANRYFLYSTKGTLNIYKLFVEEIIERYCAAQGYCSLLVPNSILSDKTCAQLRKRILETCAIKSIRLQPESSSTVDASQALCSLLIKKGEQTDNIYIQGSVSDGSTRGDFYDSEDVIDREFDNSILILSKNEYKIRNIMKKHPPIKELSFIHNLRGELDLTINRDSINLHEKNHKLLRGRNIAFYTLVDTDNLDGVDEAFIANSQKKKYIFLDRIACQQIANMAKKHRVSFAYVPKGYVLGNSCNYISVDNNEYDIDLYYLLGILNSSIVDWFFRLTSSNNHINNYEINEFPIPVDYPNKKGIADRARQYIIERDDKTLIEIEQLVLEAYGISNNQMNDCDDVELSEDGQTVTRFFSDVKNIIPAITLEDCKNILSDNASIEDISFEKKREKTTFEGKVLKAIEAKYKKLNSGTILNHTTYKLSNLDLEMIRPVPQGGNWKDIPIETVKKSKRLERITKTGGRTTLYGRINYKEPAYTITTYFNRPGNGTYVHPHHERVLSVREAARFQCFPDSYYFCGNKTDLLKQVGNAVPTIFAYCIAKRIKDLTGCSKSVDLFSGAGGMTYGFKQAGITAVVANDIEEPACITLKTNMPEIEVVCGDITKEEVKDKVINLGQKGEADIICGGPPCQGFSMAGFRRDNDPRNRLFRDFADIVSKINPKIIIFENVEGLLSYQNGETYRNIIQLFSELGYNIEGRKLLTSNYGVPQKRKRVILIGTRKDINVLPSVLFPKEITGGTEEQISAYETIFDLENVPCEEEAKYNSTYSSNILSFLRGNISASEYVNILEKKHEDHESSCNEVSEKYEQLQFFNDF